MKPQLFVHPLTDDERATLQRGLHSTDSYVLRRSQIILFSADGMSVTEISTRVGYHAEWVRRLIHRFNQEGVDVLERKKRGPKQVRRVFPQDGKQHLLEILHRTPRTYGKASSLWTLALLAQVCHEQGLTEHPLSSEGMRQVLLRLGIHWKRAKHWLVSSDPQYELKKKRRDRWMTLAEQHPDWAVGFQDETWWSRLTHPNAHAWTADKPLHLVQQAAAKDDPDPKAFACFGIDMRIGAKPEVWLRFVEGNPKSDPTIQFLDWVLQRASKRGIRVLIMFWDHASWHKSQVVRQWIRQHNQTVKTKREGIRLLAVLLPKKSPWLNPIEPRWIHAKRKVMEPDRILSVDELSKRVCAVFNQPPLPWLSTNDSS
jgi:transposase